MAQFELATLWRIGSPLTEVWEAIYHSASWPEWWPGLESVVELDPGGDDGIGNVRRFTWKGVLPYQLIFDIRITRIEHLHLIEGAASGDVTGTGVWRFAQENGVTMVRYEWSVRMETFGMKALAWVARPLVRWNHNKVMQWGARGLARRLRPYVLVTQVNPSSSPL